VGLVGGEQVEGEWVGAAGDQVGEPVAAGDQYQAVVSAGEQRFDLAGVAGVVEQHQHALVGQLGAVEGGPVGQVDGDFLGRYAEGVEESADRVGRVHDRAGGVEAA
jgi:hypothetical protein